MKAFTALSLTLLASLSAHAAEQPASGNVKVIGRQFPMDIDLDVQFNGSCSVEDSDTLAPVDANGNFTMPAVTGLEENVGDTVYLRNHITGERVAVLSRGAANGSFAAELQRTFVVHEAQMGFPTSVHVTWPAGTLKNYVAQILAVNPALAKATREAKNPTWTIVGNVSLSRQIGLVQDAEAVVNSSVKDCNYVVGCWATQKETGAATALHMQFNQAPKSVYVVDEDFRQGLQQALVSHDLRFMANGEDEGKIQLILAGEGRPFGTVASITLATVPNSQPLSPGRAVEISLLAPGQVREYEIFNAGGGVIEAKP
jgi:hypothetical protein